MAMTKKDFIDLADTLRPVVKQGELSAEALNAIIYFCKKQNRNFMEGRWLDYMEGKCGPSGGRVRRSPCGTLPNAYGRKSMRDFIRENREELTRLTGATNDREREMWIANDEGLYNWARRSGVDI